MSASDIPDTHADPMAMTLAERRDAQEYSRRRYLPEQIDATRRKLRALLIEAKRYGMTEIVNDTWDQVIHDAQAEARANGCSIGFGEFKRGVDEL